MNNHYFKNLADGLTYLFVAFLIPIVMLLAEMIFSFNNVFCLIISIMILTFSLGRDYFFAYYEDVNNKYLLFGILLGVQLVISSFFFAVAGKISGKTEYQLLFIIGYVFYCVITLFFFLYPLPYFIKDCIELSREFSAQKTSMKPGPLSNNNMVHGANHTNENKS